MYENTKLTCRDQNKAYEHLDFCRDFVYYPIALDASISDLRLAVKQHDHNATLDYFYHLSAMGLDPWHFETPSKETACTKAAKRLACFTHFPKCEHGKTENEETKYLRPCRGTCNFFYFHKN